MPDSAKAHEFIMIDTIAKVENREPPKISRMLNVGDLMLDRAPILLGTACDLASIGRKTIAVRAIGAVNSVENQIVAAFDLFDPVDQKATA